MSSWAEKRKTERQKKNEKILELKGFGFEISLNLNLNSEISSGLEVSEEKSQVSID